MSRTIFTNGKVFDGENASRDGVSVVVEGRHIAAVEPGSIETGSDDRVVDLAGRSLMPGMAQCHFHTGFGPDSGSVGPVLGLNMPAAYLGMVAAKNAQTAIDNGVTSIVGSSNGDLLDVCLKEAIALGQTRGPRVIPCTREFMAPGDDADGTNRSWFMQLGNTGLIRRVSGVEEIRRSVRQEVGRGCEIVKLSISKGHGASPTDESLYFTPAEIQAAVDTAHELGALVRAHCPSRKGVLACARAGVDIIDHADRIDDEGIEAVVAANASIAPSMLWSERYIGFADSWDYNMGPFPIGNGFPETRWQTDSRLAGVKLDYEHTVGMLPKMVDAGVNLVLGDDYGFAMMPHGDYVSEMEIYAKHGVSPLEIARWATRNGARAMHKSDELGTIEAGKLADLVVVNGEPTHDLSALREPGIVAVMKDGVFEKDRL
jgi:imidazolonepropionase-like amidohydrolase